MHSILTKRERELLEYKRIRGENFRFAHVADKWRVSAQTIRNVLYGAEWKLRLMDFFPILGLNGRVINQLSRFYHNGYSMEVVISLSDYQLLGEKLVGRRSLPALRTLAEMLIHMPQERRKEAQDFLFGLKSP